MEKGLSWMLQLGFREACMTHEFLADSIIYEKAEHGDILASGPIHRVDGSAIQPYLVRDSAPPPRGGTLGIFGWGCAAGTLEPWNP